jgi:hypothetical protein
MISQEYFEIFDIHHVCLYSYRFTSPAAKSRAAKERRFLQSE